MFTLGGKSGAQLTTDRPVAYFCAEYGITDALPIYSGGLGVLAGDIVQEAARRQLPFVAVGLFYRYGYFHQEITPDGQHEERQNINPAAVPLELLTNKDGDTLLIEVPIHERTVYVQCWRFSVGSNSLYLLDTDHWKNSDDDRNITDQLYSGDQEKRLRQEIVLALGGYRLLQAIGITPALYHMNEGHSAFLALELLRDSVKLGLTIKASLPVVKNRLVFTNHTLVPAGNDAFTHDQIRHYLGRYLYTSALNIDEVLTLGSPKDQPDRFAMAIFAMRMSAASNAVSKLHAKKAVNLWPEHKLLAITNGVHLPAWVAPEWQGLWDEQLPGWRDNISNGATWKPVRKIKPELIWDIHQQRKGRLMDEVYARTGIQLDPNALTVVWARRFATYKRPDLLFADIEKLKSLLFNTERPLQIIVAGKSHPADTQGKELIEKIEHLASYELKHRAVFVDDYSISLARILVSGADVWLNTPIFGLEASGTSGMKAAANGVIQCTVPDGWANEVDWYGLGFALPAEKTEQAIYPLFEKKIIPLFYRRNGHDIPEGWVQLMRDTIANLSPRFSATRMVDDYLYTMYLPRLNNPR